MASAASPARPRALPQFVRAVGIDGQPQYGQMQLFTLALGRGDYAYYAKDSVGNMYLLGSSDDKGAVADIRNTLAGRGYSRAFGLSPAASGSLAAPARPRALPQFVRAVGIEGKPQYGEMWLFRGSLRVGGNDDYYAKDSGGNMYPLRSGSDKGAIKEIRVNLAVRGYSRAFVPPPATGSLGAQRPPVQQTVPQTAPTPLTSTLVPTLEHAIRKNWLFEVLGSPNQYVYELWKGPHDYRVRMIVDHFVTAEQPASISFKSRLASVGGFGKWLGSVRTGRGPLAGDLKATMNPLNFTVRHESSASATSVSTKLQFGYDVSGASSARQHEYIDCGEPVMDLISIDTKGDAVIDRLRSDLSVSMGQRPELSTAMQDAISMGGYVRWRRLWVDARTGERSGVDVVLGLKAEVAAQVKRAVGGAPLGDSERRTGLDTKADIEATVRIYGPMARRGDVHQLTRMASTAIAEFLIRPPEQPVVLAQQNGGDADRARKIISSNLVFGASVWQLAAVSGGRNQGHAAVALANRVDELLHGAGLLARGHVIDRGDEATRLLHKLYRDSTPEQRERIASQLANRIDVNFGLSEVVVANRVLLDARPMSERERGYRQLFLAH